MHWYDKLNQYFPVEEMKSRAHIEALLRHRGDIYHLDDSPTHVLLYVETDAFIFVDYLLVTAEARGKGLGRRLLHRLKAKGKPVILEMEPLDDDDPDTAKRLRFYHREGFRHAEAIRYRRRSLATQRINELEIYYWTPDPSVTERDIFAYTQETYCRIHTYRDHHFYGASYQPVDEVLTVCASLAA